MTTFRSVIVMCLSFLLAGFFVLDFFRNYTRYEFLVKGDVCVAFDRKEDALKVIGIAGCITIPLTKTMEQKMREQVEIELANKFRTELSNKAQFPMVPQNAVVNPQFPFVQPNVGGQPSAVGVTPSAVGVTPSTVEAQTSAVEP